MIYSSQVTSLSTFLGTSATISRKWDYSELSIYWPRNVRFLVFIVHHLCSQIKFHINVYFRIHRSRDVIFPPLSLVNHGPDTAFPTWILSHGSFEKIIEASYLCGICEVSYLCGIRETSYLCRIREMSYLCGICVDTSATSGRLNVCIESTRIYLR
jgi:hypothetical protein